MQAAVDSVEGTPAALAGVRRSEGTSRTRKGDLEKGKNHDFCSYTFPFAFFVTFPGVDDVKDVSFRYRKLIKSLQ